MWRDQALEHGAVDDLRDTEREHRQALLAFAKDNPELLERLEYVEPLIEAVGGDAEVLDTARRFAEAANE